jgi:hypothetical protein
MPVKVRRLPSRNIKFFHFTTSIYFFLTNAIQRFGKMLGTRPAAPVRPVAKNITACPICRIKSKNVPVYK